MAEPPLGLPNYFLSQPRNVPEDDYVTTYFQARPQKDLLQSCTTAANLVQYPIKYLTFLPLPFVPAFINVGYTPRPHWTG
jgi:hypothetical protein